MSKAERQRRESLGHRAEFLAANYLRLKGYKILSQRFKTKSGEIDIIASRGDLIVFIEVKARKTLLEARDAISGRSKRRIIKCGGLYIGKNRQYQSYGIRYDAVFVVAGWSVVHEKDFWRA